MTDTLSLSSMSNGLQSNIVALECANRAKLRSTNNLKITEGKIYKDSVDDIENVDYDEGDDVLEVIGNTRMSPMSEIVLAQYSADGEWYKASIIKKDLANKRVFVSYTDFYGSEEWIDYPQKIKPYDPSSDYIV